jgi:hypothetical protein
MKYANSYTFIVDEFRAGTIKKINDLDRFLDEQKKGEMQDVNKETDIVGRMVQDQQ